MSDPEIKTLKPSEFPPLLQEIADPPKLLHLRGKFPDGDAKYICVIGSRKYTNYGKDVCEKLIAGLRGHNIVVVSGLALGMDSIAHRAALASGIKTVSAPASGLNWDVIYPRRHEGLAKDILAQEGALVSEFDRDFRATMWSFPKRNRVMAGISHAVLVIEAAPKSGTLITARLAMEYNREVLVVPGSIFSENSRGSHWLLRDGATPVTSSEEILQELGLEIEKKPGQNGLELLSENEHRVIELLGNPVPKDKLIRHLEMPINEANTLLSAMEIKGLIVERLGEVRVK